MSKAKLSDYRIFSYLKPYKWLVVLTIAVGAISTAATGGIALQTKTVIEVLSGSVSSDLIKKFKEVMAAAGASEAEILRVVRRLETDLAGNLVEQLDSAMAAENLPPDMRGLVNESVRRAASPDSQWDTLWHVSILLAGLGVVVAIGEFGKMYLKRYIAFRIDYDLRNNLCRHLLGLSIGFFNDKRNGDLLSNMTNDIATANQALMLVFDCVNVPLELLSAIIFSAILYPPLAIAMMVLMPVIALPTWKYRKKIRKASADRLSRLADLTQGMSQLLTGIRTVKSFRMEDREVEEFQRVGRGVLRKSMKATRARAASTAFTTFLSRFGTAIVTLGVGYLIIFHADKAGLGLTSEPLKLEHVIPFLAYTAIGYKAIKQGAKDYNGLVEYLPASERLFQVFDAKPSISDHREAVPLPGVSRSIAFRNVEFGYNSVPVLKDLNLTVEAGSIVAIVGHSGAGKSTMLDLIPRFYDPQAGTIEIDGIDVRRIRRDDLLANIAIVGQDPFLFNTTIAENIRYGRRDASLEQIMEAARAASIHDFIQSQPESYDTIVGEQGVRLSGGQKQRLTIARAILRDAPILILDEATSSLDTESEKLVQAALRNLMKGRTTFVIAHRLSTVQNADSIVVLRDGRIVEQGKHEQLLALGAEYARLYNSQESGPGEAGGMIGS